MKNPFKLNTPLAILALKIAIILTIGLIFIIWILTFTLNAQVPVNVYNNKGQRIYKIQGNKIYNNKGQVILKTNIKPDPKPKRDERRTPVNK